VIFITLSSWAGRVVRMDQKCIQNVNWENIFEHQEEYSRVIWRSP